MVQINRVRMKEVKKVAETLFLAFQNEPFFDYLLSPTSWKSAKSLTKFRRDFFDYIAYAFIMSGTVYEIDGFKGVALWAGPGQDPYSTYTVLRSGLWRCVYRVPKEVVCRYTDEYLSKTCDARERLMGKKKHWYLCFLAVRPEHQKRGLSRPLLDEVHRLCDKKKQQIYLECNQSTNRSYYEHLGYSLNEMLQFDNNGSPISLAVMSREAH
ncbi:hypothetical protein SJAG_01619 [Schizosaccharomyces japonicus yFS275]|uniref:N-acetyltransferase domain-containing protein n=1 Tax=Schizosaccharomyces japonicus (strain yFS275 / FY16936) TaxID=402676 RepID=B6JYF7_SCHJY|nr:hypothetical protein SJAG_01619 [Schizosaccharomyces japonicus yFS275]EEB06575.1 hypothetical protein SJAG_01619 [Schizosaccharomyces japonicus yFS275]